MRVPSKLGSVVTAVVLAVGFILIDAVSSTSAPLRVVSAPTRVAPPGSGANTLKGLHIFTLGGRRYGISTAIHVLTFQGSHYQVKIGLARHAIDGGEQTPSSMCRSTAHCVAAVNGDFFDTTHHGNVIAGDEVGAIIQDCVLVHTPEVAHQQVNLDDHSVSQGFNWSDTIDVKGVIVPITSINQQLPLSYANVNLPLVGTLLFTSPYALRTPSATGRITYEFTQVDRSTRPTAINTTTQLRLVAATARAIKVDVGYVDISAPRDSAFAQLRVGDTVPMTTTSTSGCDNLGGHPILLNDGVVEPPAPADVYMLRRYARTVIGWTLSKETVLLTVDGRDGVSGADAHQLVSLLRSLKVVTAIDLDGGQLHHLLRRRSDPEPSLERYRAAGVDRTTGHSSCHERVVADTPCEGTTTRDFVVTGPSGSVERLDFAEAKALSRVVISHARGLSQGKANRGTHEFESVAHQLLTHDLGARGAINVAVGDRPQVVGKTGIFAALSQGKDGVGVGDDRDNLLTMTNHARVVHYRRRALITEAGDNDRVEVLEHPPIALATSKHRQPTQTRLCALQSEKFEE